MMRIDARIPVLVLPGSGRPAGAPPLPAADPHALLLLAGEATAIPAEGWSAVRRVPPDAVLASTVHGSGCSCCVGRAGLAVALSELFRERAMGRLDLFRRVVLVVPAADTEAVAAMLLRDPLVAGQFRPETALLKN
jgi:hypothetical protein